MAPPNITFDMENGLATDEEKAKQGLHVPNFQGNEEYINLVKYISTYRDGRRRSSVAVSAEGDILETTPKRPWWAFWRPKPKTAVNDGIIELPDEWLLTDIRQGLSARDVDIRRRRVGYNELTTEKENMVSSCCAMTAEGGTDVG
jgi:H+-transporting ATPase